MVVDSKGETRFQEELRISARVANRICSQRGLTHEDADDFRSYVMLKMIENDYARFRRFEGRSRLETYIVVVLQRLYIDYIVQRRGKWRPSTKAKKLGTEATRLEQLVYRDGLSFGEAWGIVAGDPDSRETRERLWDLFVEIPVRARRKTVGLQALDREHPHTVGDAVRDVERRRLGQELQTRLRQVFMTLSNSDRSILKMRYQDRLTVRQISIRFGVDYKRMSSRHRKLLSTLRARLRRFGLGKEDAKEILDWPDHELDFDELLGAAPFVTESGTSASKCLSHVDDPPRGSGYLRAS